MLGVGRVRREAKGDDDENRGESGSRRTSLPVSSPRKGAE